MPTQEDTLDPKIIVLSFQRNATQSTWSFLNNCGLKGLHHITQRKSSHSFKGYSIEEIKEDIEHYESEFEHFSDAPYFVMYEHFDKKYPNSKFILITRDKNDWLESFKKLMLTEGAADPVSFACYQEYIKDLSSYDMLLLEDNVLIAMYEKHNSDVIEYFKDTDSLLVMDINDPDKKNKIGYFLNISPNENFGHIDYINESLNKKYVLDNYLGYLAFPEYDNCISSYIESHGIWEAKEFQWLVDNIKEGDVCLNIGANVGYFSTLMSKLVKESGKVYAIEPNIEFEKYIKENANLSGFNNLEVFMCAAGDKNEKIDLFINSENSGDNRVFNPEIITNQSHDEILNVKNVITVDMYRVDDLIQDRKINIVLIDSQGWDYKVIRGMHEIIKSSKPKILTQFVPKWVKDIGDDPESVLEEYISLGYEIHCPGLGLNFSLSPIEVLSAIEKSGIWFANLYLHPKTF